MAPAHAAAEPPKEACTSHPPAVVELEIQSCRPGAVAIEEEIAGTRLWWLRPYLESVAYGNPGVVLSGRVHRLREVVGAQLAAAWQESELQADFFYTSSDPDFCGTFADLETVLLLREEPCCDIIPPAGVACVLDVFEVRPLSPEMKQRANDELPTASAR